jgi:hypothetical protein
VRKRSLAAVFCVVTLGCASVESVTPGMGKSKVTAQSVFEGTRVVNDGYKRSASVSAPELGGDLEHAGANAYYRAHLRGLSKANGAESFQLYVATHLEEGWQNFRAARDQMEIPLAVSKVDRKKRCKKADNCNFYEHFGVALSRDYLEARRTRGVELRVMGNGGESVVLISPAHVEGFMRRFDSVRRAQSASTASTRTASRKSFCSVKFGQDLKAQKFCQQQAKASYERLSSALARTETDSFTDEARALNQCMTRHGGRMGLDWMMVEHCFGRVMERSPAATAGR